MKGSFAEEVGRSGDAEEDHGTYSIGGNCPKVRFYRGEAETGNDLDGVNIIHMRIEFKIWNRHSRDVKANESGGYGMGESGLAYLRKKIARRRKCNRICKGNNTPHHKLPSMPLSKTLCKPELRIHSHGCIAKHSGLGNLPLRLVQKPRRRRCTRQPETSHHPYDEGYAPLDDEEPFPPRNMRVVNLEDAVCQQAGESGGCHGEGVEDREAEGEFGTGVEEG